MGEYIKNTKTGEGLKIGMMDECFATYQQMKKWRDAPEWVDYYNNNKDMLNWYLTEPSVIFVGIDNLGTDKKDSARNISIITMHPEYIEHEKTCANGKKRWLSIEDISDYQILDVYIKGERYDKNGVGRTIFRCKGCDVLFSLPQEDIDLTLASKLEKDQQHFYANILKARPEVIAC